MKFDTGLLTPDLKTVGGFAKSAENIGFDGIWISETHSDPFLACTLSAEHTENTLIGTGIAVAFPRSPTTLAYIAWDLARYTNGQFALGLGTQVRAHNERRFGVKWEKPVRKMRESIEAIHAVWDCWQTGAKLDYEGEFFKLNLMTPFFSPKPLKTGKPPIYIAAVNRLMLKLVGRRCDGVMLHAFSTKKYMDEVARPAIEAGLADAGRSWKDVSISTGLFTVPTDDETHPASHFEQFCKQQISFYMSTPAYRVVTELHNWEATARQLSQMARENRWTEMPALITDEMMSEFVVTGKWSEIPSKIHAKYSGFLDRVSYYTPFVPGESDAGWQQSVEAFKALQ